MGHTPSCQESCLCQPFETMPISSIRGVATFRSPFTYVDIIDIKLIVAVLPSPAIDLADGLFPGIIFNLPDDVRRALGQKRRLNRRPRVVKGFFERWGRARRFVELFTRAVIVLVVNG